MLRSVRPSSALGLPPPMLRVAPGSMAVTPLPLMVPPYQPRSPVTRSAPAPSRTPLLKVPCWTLTSAPDVGSCAANKLDLFVRGADRGVWRRTYNGSWGAWSGLGGPMSSGPSAVCLPGTTTLDVFVAASNYSLLKQSLAG